MNGLKSSAGANACASTNACAHGKRYDDSLTRRGVFWIDLSLIIYELQFSAGSDSCTNGEPCV